MKIFCPYCRVSAKASLNFVRFGHFFRKSDCQVIQRFRCRTCQKSFSQATFNKCYLQNKRHKNGPIRRLFSSGVSLRRSALLLGVNRTTVARKLKFLGNQARLNLRSFNAQCAKAEVIEFDDLETFEHTKCKPLSITLAVESKTRRILGFSVSQMPAKGHLAKMARRKYGFRKDYRTQGRRALFLKLRPLIKKCCVIKSDSNPHYVNDVREFFPNSSHVTYFGQRGAVSGQGELKKIRFDPLFSLNHTCAMFRANVNRLFRKTWCTTKRPDRLSDHLAIYANFHNQNLKLRNF
jgi:transposase-like protein